MLLLILAVLWGIVLIPPALRARAERRRVESVDTFRRRLQVLAPPQPPVAARPPGASRPAEAARAHVALVVEPLAVRLPVPPPRAPSSPAEPQHRPAAHRALSAASSAPVRVSRAAVLRRRRHVLGALVATSAVTATAAVVTGLLYLWGAHVVADLGVVAYLAGLRRLRRLALERMAKVRYLPAGVGAASGPGATPSARPTGRIEAPLRRSASS